MLNLLFAFLIDSKEVWGCFLMSGVRMLHFLKDWWKFIQIYQYYIMALKHAFNTFKTVFGSALLQ